MRLRSLGTRKAVPAYILLIGSGICILFSWDGTFPRQFATEAIGIAILLFVMAIGFMLYAVGLIKEK